MPELPYSNQEIRATFQKVREKIYDRKDKFISIDEIEDILQDTRLILVGVGAESIVLKVGKDGESEGFSSRLRKFLIGDVFSRRIVKEKEIVISLDYKETVSLLEAKRRYHVHSIMNILFPHNFPKFLTSFSVEDDDSAMSGTARSEVDIVKQSRKRHGKDFDKRKYPFRKVLKAVQNLDLPFGFDSTSKNYVLGKDGGVYYLDSIIYHMRNRHLQQINLVKWMRHHSNYSDKDIERVLSSIKKIGQIDSEINED